jgi:hypothetical protein
VTGLVTDLVTGLVMGQYITLSSFKIRLTLTSIQRQSTIAFLQDDSDLQGRRFVEHNCKVQLHPYKQQQHMYRVDLRNQ